MPLQHPFAQENEIIFSAGGLVNCTERFEVEVSLRWLLVINTDHQKPLQCIANPCTLQTGELRFQAPEQSAEIFLNPGVYLQE